MIFIGKGNGARPSRVPKMTNIEQIAKLEAVARISAPWGSVGRCYITLANTSKSARGDSRKVYVTETKLVAEPY
uniref:hypothetical protein n=1 Tax=Pseudomonas lurida TaxID=244566 RepID=UPI0030D9DC74